MNNLRKLFLFSVVFVAVGLLTGCFGPTYKKYTPSPVGTFYPNGCVQMLGRYYDEVLSPKGYYNIVCDPMHISEVGIMHYSGWDLENAGDHEAARLDFSDRSWYVWTSTLRMAGRIEYTGYETIPERALKSMHRIWGFVFAVVVVFIGLAIIGFFLGAFNSGGGTWTGGGRTGDGGTWSGRGTFKK